MKTIVTRRRFGAMTAIGLAVSASAGFAQDDPIRIGAINPYSGPYAQYGDEVTKGFELAAKQANEKGGVAGRQVEIIRGNATSAQEGIGAVEQLVGREDVDILTGTYISAISNSASETALNYGKLFWETNALALGLTERQLPNYVRSGPNAVTFAERSVEGALEVVAEKLGKAPEEMDIWLEHEDSAYGTSIAEEQKRLLEEAGATVGVGTHSARSIDLTDSILRAKNAEPDLWINTGYVIDTNLLLRTSQEQDFTPPAVMLMGVGDTSETLEALGEDFLEGILLVSYPRPDISDEFGVGSQEYLDAYREAYDREPIAPQGMNAYVGAQMLFEAIEAAGSTDFEALVEAAKSLSKPQGSYATGYGVEFDDTMQNTLALPVIAQWQEGEVRAVFPEAAANEGVEVVNLPRK